MTTCTHYSSGRYGRGQRRLHDSSHRKNNCLYLIMFLSIYLLNKYAYQERHGSNYIDVFIADVYIYVYDSFWEGLSRRRLEVLRTTPVRCLLRLLCVSDDNVLGPSSVGPGAQGPTEPHRAVIRGCVMLGTEP